MSNHAEHYIHTPDQRKSRPNSSNGIQSKTMTGQHRSASEQKAKASSLPAKSVGTSRFGLFSKSADVNKQEALFDAAAYLEEQKAKSIDLYTAKSVEDVVTHIAGNYLKNTFITKATPIAKSVANLAELNLTVAPFVFGGAGVKLGYEAMSIGTRVIMGKALIGGAQGLAGSMAAGGDRYDQLFSSGLGAFLGSTFNIDTIPQLSRLSYVAIGATSGFLSNGSGQLFTVSRNPEERNFSFVSLGLSSWASGITSLLTKYGAAGITGAIVQSTVQKPADIIGSHISEDFRNAYR